jgi:formylglycine-generating enzyme required for sulfatase activity
MVASTEPTRETESKARIFISYSRKDMAFADRLEAALKARGFEPLIDRSEIYAFEDWWQRIKALIGRADTVVFVLSPDAVASDVALKEVAHAASLNKRFAPIVHRRVEDGVVPEALRRLNFIFFDDPDRFDARADQLAEALQIDIAWIRRHTEFGEAARRWIGAGRAGGFLLRPPLLDQAEAWLTLRPRGAPAPTAETEAFVAQSRKAVLGTRRLWRAGLASMFTLLIGIIIGLVGWINQAYIADQWRWWTVTRPYAQAQVWPDVLSAARERALKLGDSFKECLRDCPEMVVVPAGSFIMGSPPTEKGRYSTEGPQHNVAIAKSFAVSKYEIRFVDWDACVTGGGCSSYKPNDFGWGRGLQPVVNVSWEDARQYVTWLSAVTGKVYRLLSEAEYEYAARAGTQTPYPWGDSIKLNGTAMANCKGCDTEWAAQPMPVGSFPANPFGLYDMVGNIWEWAEDCWHSNYNAAPRNGSAWIDGSDCRQRIVRGGAGTQGPDEVRSARRGYAGIEQRTGGTGFRVARTLD